MCSENPEFDNSYTKTRVFIANVRNHLHNLKTHYKTDLLDKDSAGHKFLSHIIFGKLSKELRQAFTWETGTDYPTFAQILDTYSKVINSVVRNRRKKPMTRSNNKAGNSNKSWQAKTNNNSAAPTLSFAVAEGGNPAKPAVLHCRFCNVNGHSNLHCPNYITCEDRIKKCKELKICFYCSSLKHEASACPGLQNRLYRAC